MPAIPTEMGIAGKRQLSEAWRNMVCNQGLPLYPVLETVTVPLYRPLGSLHKRRKNLLGAIFKYLPCVCGSLQKKAENRVHGTCLLLQHSFRQQRQR